MTANILVSGLLCGLAYTGAQAKLRAQNFGAIENDLTLPECDPEAFGRYLENISANGSEVFSSAVIGDAYWFNVSQFTEGRFETAAQAADRHLGTGAYSEPETLTLTYKFAEPGDEFIRKKGHKCNTDISEEDRIAFKKLFDEISQNHEIDFHEKPSDAEARIHIAGCLLDEARSRATLPSIKDKQQGIYMDISALEPNKPYGFIADYPASPRAWLSAFGSSYNYDGTLMQAAIPAGITGVAGAAFRDYSRDQKAVSEAHTRVHETYHILSMLHTHELSAERPSKLFRPAEGCASIMSYDGDPMMEDGGPMDAAILTSLYGRRASPPSETLAEEEYSSVEYASRNQFTPPEQDGIYFYPDSRRFACFPAEKLHDCNDGSPAPRIGAAILAGATSESTGLAALGVGAAAVILSIAAAAAKDTDKALKISKNTKKAASGAARGAGAALQQAGRAVASSCPVPFRRTENTAAETDRENAAPRNRNCLPDAVTACGANARAGMASAFSYAAQTAGACMAPAFSYAAQTAGACMEAVPDAVKSVACDALSVAARDSFAPMAYAADIYIAYKHGAQAAEKTDSATVNALKSAGCGLANVSAEYVKKTLLGLPAIAGPEGVVAAALLRAAFYRPVNLFRKNADATADATYAQKLGADPRTDVAFTRRFFQQRENNRAGMRDAQTEPAAAV